jgi:hypothetical protein
MGRTIHYWIEKDGLNAITDEQWRKIEELQDEYNDSHDWTCEKIAFERLNVFPIWGPWRAKGLNFNEVWVQIYEAMDMPKGIEELKEQGLVEVRIGGYMGEKCLASGFTKVRENEENAALVIKFLIEASFLASGVKIKVSDEGDYLICPVFISKGRLWADEEAVKSSIEYCKRRASEDPADKLEFWIRQVSRLMQYLNLDYERVDNAIFINPHAFQEG